MGASAGRGATRMKRRGLSAAAGARSRTRSTRSSRKKEDGEASRGHRAALYPFHSNRKRSSLAGAPAGRPLPPAGEGRAGDGDPAVRRRAAGRTATEFTELSGELRRRTRRATVSGSGTRTQAWCSAASTPWRARRCACWRSPTATSTTAQDWDAMVQYATEEQKGVGDCPAVEDKLTLLGVPGLPGPRAARGAGRCVGRLPEGGHLRAHGDGRQHGDGEGHRAPVQHLPERRVEGRRREQGVAGGPRDSRLAVPRGGGRAGAAAALLPRVPLQGLLGGASTS